MLMELIKKRHSIRKYTDRQVSRSDLMQILEADSYAPNAGGGQRSLMVGIRDKALADELGSMNLVKFDRNRLAGSYVSKEQPSNIDDPTIKKGFYGAPCAIVIFASNSSLPLSSDQTGSGKPKWEKSANEYNSRGKTTRKAGGQKGHKGTTLTKSDIEKVINEGQCIHETVDIGRGADTPCGAVCISKYIVDLDVRTKITELRSYPDTNGEYHIPSGNVSDVVYGDSVKALAVGLYSEGVMSNDRIAAFINSQGGDAFRLSEGSVYGFCRKFSEKAAPITDKLAEGLLTEGVVMTDATTVTVDGKQEYIRNFSSGDTAVYFYMDSKTIKKMKELPFLGRYAGTLVHDHETAMYHFGTGHGECNVHVIRYLRKNNEDTGNSWSDKMIELLCEINTGRKGLIAEGKETFTGGGTDRL